MTFDEMHMVAQYLYKLLDDISAAGDMAKSDDKLYRGMVERIQAKKGEVVQTNDGYTISFQPVSLAAIKKNKLEGCISSEGVTKSERGGLSL